MIKTKVLSWNLQFGRNLEHWPIDKITSIANMHDICFLQEVPNILLDKLHEKLTDFWPCEKDRGQEYSIVTFVKKQSCNDKFSNPWNSHLLKDGARSFALISQTEENKLIINLHLKAMDGIRRKIDIEALLQKIGNLQPEWVGGDLNCDPCEAKSLMSMLKVKLLDNISRFSCDYVADSTVGSYEWKLFDYVGKKNNATDNTVTVSMFCEPCGGYRPCATRHWPVSTLSNETINININEKKYTVSMPLNRTPKPIEINGQFHLWRDASGLGYKVGTYTENPRNYNDQYYLRTDGSVFSKTDKVECGSWSKSYTQPSR